MSFLANIFTKRDRKYILDSGELDVRCNGFTRFISYINYNNYNKQTDIIVSDKDECYLIAKLIFTDMAKQSLKKE